MTHGFRPYPEYKDSGVSWLGAIPANWAAMRCKYLFREVDARSETGEETHLSMSQKHGLIPSKDMDGRRLHSESYAGGKLCQPHDLVLNRLKAHLGVFAHARQSGVVSPDYTVLRPAFPEHVVYFEHVFKTPACVAALRCSTRGIVEGFWRLYTDDFYRIQVPLPPASERDAILAFLRSVDVTVRRFIRNRRRLIEVLNEQKQAIIDESVVSERCPIKRLRNVAELRVSNVDKHSKPGEQPVRLCNYTDVYKNTTIRADMPFMAATATPEEVKAFRLEVGDVIITKDSEDWQDIGVPALVEETAEDLVCGYHLAILRPKRMSLTGPFLAYVLRSRFVVTQFSIAANGVTRYGLSHGAIKSITLSVPPLPEQERIVRHIDQATATLNHALSRAAREIELIQEYRTRLIADVITGKLDVRGFVPTGPMLADEPADEAIEEVGLEDEDAELVEEAVDAAD